ncbi:IPT/TIG domain-containing protein [Streptomyces tailanensis]|uniref:IPT/TIG domain-containing protein n=1 Tax=Streptomyces tailanensis TaxID=2569858 RepID=UPI003CCC64F2
MSYLYVGAPFKSSLDTTSGPMADGNPVTINGTGLSTATSVSFGTTSVTPTVVNDGRLSVVVPAGLAAGPVSVSVTTAGGTGNGLTYTYVDNPTIGTINPEEGPTSGGTWLTITGTNLDSTTSVTIGGDTAPFEATSATSLRVVTPPGTAGPAGCGRDQPLWIGNRPRRIPVRRGPRRLTGPTTSLSERR